MKKLILLMSLMVITFSSYSQLFDGTIDGSIPGPEDLVVEHFIKKGYTIQEHPDCPPDIKFLLGNVEFKKKKELVLIYLLKEQDTDFVRYITLYFPKEEKLKDAFEEHKKMFTKKFGKPTKQYVTKSKWVMGIYTYTIGVEEESVYHKIELNYSLRKVE